MKIKIQQNYLISIGSIQFNKSKLDIKNSKKKYRNQLNLFEEKQNNNCQIDQTFMKPQLNHYEPRQNTFDVEKIQNRQVEHAFFAVIHPENVLDNIDEGKNIMISHQVSCQTQKIKQNFNFSHLKVVLILNFSLLIITKLCKNLKEVEDKIEKFFNLQVYSTIDNLLRHQKQIQNKQISNLKLETKSSVVEIEEAKDSRKQQNVVLLSKHTITKRIFQLSKLLFVLLLMISHFPPTHSIYVDTTYPIKIYEPAFIEVATINIWFNDDTDGDTVFNRNYTITMTRIQLQNRNDYKLVVTSRQLILGLDSNSFYLEHYEWASKTVSNFQIVFDFRDYSQFSKSKMNILILSKTLEQKEQIYTIYDQLPGVTSTPTLDSQFGTASCSLSRSLSTTLPSTNYRPYLIMVTTYWTRNSNLANFPQFNYVVTLTSTSSYQLDITAKFLKYYYLSMYILLIRNDMFEETYRKPLIFYESLMYNTPQITSLALFSQTFPFYIGENFFTLLKGYMGKVIDFNFHANTPPDHTLVGLTTGSNRVTAAYALAFYSYVAECPTTYTMSVPCSFPSYCTNYDVDPVNKCIECRPGFRLALDHQSCICDPPLTILSHFCGVFPPGCTAAGISLNGTVECVSCDVTKMLILNSSIECECLPKFQFNSSGACQDKCGDGYVLSSKCDDGNPYDGDGCDHNCKLEPGFVCDTTKTPFICKSQVFLKYEIKSILKVDQQNSGLITLNILTDLNDMRFDIRKQNLLPLSSYIRLKLITSEWPYEQYLVNDMQMVQFNSDYEIVLKFNYLFTVQQLRAQLFIDYSNTPYIGRTQMIDFRMNSGNLPLKIQQNQREFFQMRSALLGGSAVNMFGLMIGLFTPKFIGLQSILTLQIIFYSQMLIHNIDEWPLSFSSLKYLKLACGYNDFVMLTENVLVSDITKKMSNLGMKKLIVENFNANLIILVFSFLLLLVVMLVRDGKEIKLGAQYKEKLRKIGQNKERIMLESKKMMKKMKNYNKVNQIVFWIANELSVWLVLPLISSIGAEFLIPNSQFIFIDQMNKSSIFVKLRGVIVFLTLFIIFSVCYNQFFNMWLSLSSYNEFFERPQEIYYKRLLFIYLIVIGCAVCFFNTYKITFQIGEVYCSAVVMAIQVIYILALLKIDPYKQSLKIHQRTLLFNSFTVLVFFGVINLINYLGDVDPLIFLVLGYFIVGTCGLSIIFTFIRLYYELRYGKELQIQIMEEKQAERKAQEQKRKHNIKTFEQRMIEQIKRKLDEQKRIRDLNLYLHQNQQKQVQKVELLNWIEGKNWDQKTQIKYFFKEFNQKPIEWLKAHDPQKYKQKKKQLKEWRQKQKQKVQIKKNNHEYQEILQNIRADLREKSLIKSKIKKNNQTNVKK